MTEQHKQLVAEKPRPAGLQPTCEKETSYNSANQTNQCLLQVCKQMGLDPSRPVRWSWTRPGVSPGVPMILTRCLSSTHPIPGDLQHSMEVWGDWKSAVHAVYGRPQAHCCSSHLRDHVTTCGAHQIENMTWVGEPPTPRGLPRVDLQSHQAAYQTTCK